MSKKKLRDEAKEKLLKKLGFKKVAFSAKENEKLRQEVAFLFKAKQEVIFSGDAFWKTRGINFPGWQSDSDHLRLTEDSETGIRLDILKEIIEKHVPIVENAGSTLTTKRIIDIDYIRRIGGHSSMLALIKVNFSGMIIEECWKLEGFYILRLDLKDNGYAVKVERLNGTELIHDGIYSPE